MMYKLSKLIPVRFRSTYEREITGADTPSYVPETATWWQWRGHIFRHRVV